MSITRRFGAFLVALGMAMVPFTGSRAQEAAGPPAAAEPEAELPTAPVSFDEQTLFRVRGITAYPAPDRAAAIAARIEATARDPDFDPDKLVVVPSKVGLEIRAGDTVLVTLIPADAALESVQLPTLAEMVRRKIGSAITEYRVDRDPAHLARGFVAGVVATAIFAALLFVIGILFRRIVAALERRVHAHVENLPRGAFQFVQGKQIWEAMSSTVRGARWILVLVLGYAWLQFLFSQFPWTRPLGDNLLSLVTEPLARIGTGFIDFVPNLLFLIVLALVTRYGVRLIKLYFSALERGTQTLANFEPEWAPGAYKIIRTLLLALALVMAYPYLPGSGSRALEGLSVFAGLLLSLGASGAVSNVIAGYFNTFGRVFRVGDLIKVGDVMGEVTQVRLLTTRVRTRTNEEITIPNAMITTTHLTNFTALAADRRLILHTTVGIGYEVPWRQVHAMLEEAARRTPGIVAEPAPFILQRELRDFAVLYELNAYAEVPRGMVKTYSSLHQNILDVFNEHGVQIMTPAYEGDPATPKVVPKDQWFAAPAIPPGRPPTGSA